MAARLYAPGFDASPGSLMAKLNVEGSRKTPELAKEPDFAYDPCGSLVVCNNEADLPQLDLLLQNGLQSGVEGLRIITDRDKLRAPEPGLSASPAIGCYLADLVKCKLNLQPKADFIATRKGILNPQALPFEERAALIQAQPAYGSEELFECDPCC